MVTASLMQSMVQIREKNSCFVTILLLGNFGESSFGTLGVESPHGGAMMTHIINATNNIRIADNEYKYCSNR